MLYCYGEVLFDCLPSGKIAGGAPMNVAYHAQQLGFQSAMISRVGDDRFGHELLAFLTSKNIAIDWVQVDQMHPTSTVQVALDAKGHASYTIVEPVAWDFIDIEDKVKEAVSKADMFLYGSLVTRQAKSRETLMYLLNVAPFKVFDVNLRVPFYSKKQLEPLLEQAHLVKMNDDEVAIVADWYGIKGSETAKMEALYEHFNLEGVLVTRGANGAVFYDENGFVEHGGYPVEVQDTIGSGDSFLAAFLSEYVQGNNIENCLDLACGLGAFVATQKGGTPQYAKSDILNLVKHA